MSFFDLFSSEKKKESIESNFKNVFNRFNRSQIRKVIKVLNKNRFKPGIIFQYNRCSTLITCEYSDDSSHYGGDTLGYLRIKIPQKTGSNFYETLKDISPSPGNFGEIEVNVILKNKKYFIKIDIKSKTNYENRWHARYDYETKIFKDILKTKPIIDFLINKINDFDKLDKS
jgi:hypothetical protein